MKKSRTARNLKRRVKTRKVMRGGEMNEPVNKDVIDAIKKVVDSMKSNDEYPQLQKSLEELINVSETAASTVNASSTVNATSSTVNATSPTINAASTVNVNDVPPTVNADTPAVAATNEPKTELTETSVIHYGNYGRNGKQPFLDYSDIKQRLQKMIERPKTMNPVNIPIETLKSRLEEITNAKTIPEVTAILQKYKFSDTYPPGRPAFLRFAMTGGGSRKHKMRRIKNQYTSK